MSESDLALLLSKLLTVVLYPVGATILLLLMAIAGSVL
jgi:hypothetical protein